MKAKGCINDELTWKTSRTFFFWRIRRRQAEDGLQDRLIAASNGLLSNEETRERISTLVPVSGDKEVVSWFGENQAVIDEAVQACKIEFTQKNVQQILEGLSDADIKNVLSKFGNGN